MEDVVVAPAKTEEQLRQEREEDARKRDALLQKGLSELGDNPSFSLGDQLLMMSVLNKLQNGENLDQIKKHILHLVGNFYEENFSEGSYLSGRDYLLGFITSISSDLDSDVKKEVAHQLIGFFSNMSFKDFLLKDVKDAGIKAKITTFDERGNFEIVRTLRDLASKISEETQFDTFIEFFTDNYRPDQQAVGLKSQSVQDMVKRFKTLLNSVNDNVLDPRCYKALVYTLIDKIMNAVGDYYRNKGQDVFEDERKALVGKLWAELGDLQGDNRRGMWNLLIDEAGRL